MNSLIARNMEGVYGDGGSFPSGSPFHIKAMDLNDYNSQLCRSGCSLQHLETMGNISGLAVQDLYSGSILKPTITENKNMLDLIHTTRPDSKTKTQPSTLEVVEYESTKHFILLLHYQQHKKPPNGGKHYLQSPTDRLNILPRAIVSPSHGSSAPFSSSKRIEPSTKNFS